MLARNIAVGLLGSGWTAAIGFAVVPVYLRLLGIEAYGLIGFFATLQALFQLLDMGIAPTINREVARHSAQGNVAGAAPLVRTLAWIYWMIALVLGLSVAVASPFIAKHWLQSQSLSPIVIQQAVVLLGIVIACRWPNGIYLGVLIGAQRLEVSSAITAASVTLGSVGGVLVLSFISPTIQAFFAWQICAALAGTIFMQRAAWRELCPDQTKHLTPSFGHLRQIWRFSAGMSAIGLLGLVFTQLDKVLLSRMLNLSDYGKYMLATVVTSGLYVFVTPFFNAIYPRFSVLVTRGDTDELESEYRFSTRMLTAILFPVAGFLALFSIDLLSVWTSNPEVARAAGPIVSLLAIGSALHGVMYVPHALQLAYGQTRLPLLINGTLLIIFAPLLIVLTLSYGAIGGALAWLVLHSLYVLLSTWLTHKHLLTALRFKWISSDVAVPFLISATTCVASSHAAKAISHSPIPRLLIGLAGIAIAAMICIASSAQVRQALALRFNRFRVNGASKNNLRAKASS